MEIERLYELAIKDIDIQVKLKSDRIRDKAREFKEYCTDIEKAVERVKKKIRTQSKQKFVKEYLAMVKEGEQMLQRNIDIDSKFEEGVVDLRIKAPFFNYVIG